MIYNRVPLGKVCDFIRGVSFGADDPQTSYRHGYVPILRAGNIRETLDVVNDLVYVPSSRVSREQYLTIGDIAICMSSGSSDVVGKTARLERAFGGSVGAFCGIIRPRDPSQSSFIAHWLCSSEFTQWRNAQARGANIQNLRFSQLGDLEVPLPAVPEQQRIATILDRADRLRRMRRYAQQISKTFLQAVFVQMFGSHMRAGCPMAPLGSLVRITGGGTPSRAVEEYFKGDIPWLTSKDMRGEYIFDTQEHVTQQAVENSATNLVPAGSILVVVKSKILMHRLPLAIAQVPLCHGQDIKSIQCSAGVNPLFIMYVLKQNESSLLHQARGANTEGLTLPMLQEVPVPKVPPALQQQFARTVRQFDRVRARQREAERQAEHLFQTLLHRAFSGEL